MLLFCVSVLAFAGIDIYEQTNQQQSTIYLITYSRADFSKVPTRQAFTDIVKAFEQVDIAKVAN